MRELPGLSIWEELKPSVKVINLLVLICLAIAMYLLCGCNGSSNSHKSGGGQPAFSKSRYNEPAWALERRHDKQRFNDCFKALNSVKTKLDVYINQYGWPSSTYSDIAFTYDICPLLYPGYKNADSCMEAFHKNIKKDCYFFNIFVFENSQEYLIVGNPYIRKECVICVTEVQGYPLEIDKCPETNICVHGDQQY